MELVKLGRKGKAKICGMNQISTHMNQTEVGESESCLQAVFYLLEHCSTSRRELEEKGDHDKLFQTTCVET